MCSGRSSDFRLILLPRLPISRMETVAFLRDLSPGTAAGPFRHQTGFPFHPLIRTPEAMWALIYPSPPVKSSRFLKGEGGSPVRKIDESRAKLRGTRQPVVWVSWYPALLCPDLGRQGGGPLVDIQHHLRHDHLSTTEKYIQKKRNPVSGERTDRAKGR